MVLIMLLGGAVFLSGYTRIILTIYVKAHAERRTQMFYGVYWRAYTPSQGENL
jgi:hypothetical protein